MSSFTAVTAPAPVKPASPPLFEPNPKFARLASDETIARTVAALQAHNIQVVVVDNGEQAKSRVLDMVPQGAHVYTAASRTLDATGIAAALNESGNYHSIRKVVVSMNRETEFAEIRKLQASHDIVVGSVHAVTENGYVLTASYGGSQLPAYAYGAGIVIWVVGAQKLVKDIDEGLKRIREYSLPLEDRRLRQATGRSSDIGKILIVEKEAFPGRITMIIVKENLGF